MVIESDKLAGLNETCSEEVVKIARELEPYYPFIVDKLLEYPGSLNSYLKDGIAAASYRGVVLDELPMTKEAYEAWYTKNVSSEFPIYRK